MEHFSRLSVDLLDRKTLDAKSVAAFLRLVKIASVSGGYFGLLHTKMACGGYEFDGNFKYELKKFNTTYRKATRKYSKVHLDHYYQPKGFAVSGTTMARKMIGKLLKVGAIEINPLSKNSAYRYKLNRSFYLSLRGEEAKYNVNVKVPAEIVNLSKPNKSYVLMSAFMTEAATVRSYKRRRAVQRFGSKGNLDRDGVRGGLSTAETRKFSRVDNGEVAYSLKAKESNISKSTAFRHGRLQKWNRYSKSKVIALKPGPQNIHVNGCVIQFDVPKSRLSSLYWMDNENTTERSEGIGFKGKIIPCKGGVGIQTTICIEKVGMRFTRCYRADGAKNKAKQLDYQKWHQRELRFHISPERMKDFEGYPY
jgi:hypothetical protein